MQSDIHTYRSVLLKAILAPIPTRVICHSLLQAKFRVLPECITGEMHEYMNKSHIMQKPPPISNPTLQVCDPCDTAESASQGMFLPASIMESESVISILNSIIIWHTDLFYDFILILLFQI